MTQQLSMNALLLAIKDLKIDVPILKYDQEEDGRIVIYLYGGEVKHWPPLGMAIVKKEPVNSTLAKPPVTRSQQAKSQRAKK